MNLISSLFKIYHRFSEPEVPTSGTKYHSNFRSVRRTGQSPKLHFCPASPQNTPFHTIYQYLSIMKNFKFKKPYSQNSDFLFLFECLMRTNEILTFRQFTPLIERRKSQATLKSIASSIERNSMFKFGSKNQIERLLFQG